MTNVDYDPRVYFTPGDVVTIKHDIPNKPVCWVIEKVTRNIKNKDTGDYDTMFLGIRCRWFNVNGDLQESVFSTKDLIKV